MNKENQFKKDMGVKEASSIAGEASRKHGVGLEKWLIKDINGVVNGFEGYQALDMNLKKFANNKFLLLNGAPLSSDVMITNSTERPPWLDQQSGEEQSDKCQHLKPDAASRTNRCPTGCRHVRNHQQRDSDQPDADENRIA